MGQQREQPGPPSNRDAARVRCISGSRRPRVQSAAATLQASKILPAELRSGGNFRVEEKVTNDGYLNTYRIGSRFGTFTAVSTAMLRKRIGEINALAVMEKVSGTDEFTTALKQAGNNTLGAQKT